MLTRWWRWRLKSRLSVPLADSEELMQVEPTALDGWWFTTNLALYVLGEADNLMRIPFEEIRAIRQGASQQIVVLITTTNQGIPIATRAHSKVLNHLRQLLN